MSSDRLQTRDLFLRRTDSKHPGVVESTDTWLHYPILFLRLFNLLTPYYFCFGNKWVLDPIFPEFSTPRGHRQPCKSHKLNWQTIRSEFKSQWVPRTSGRYIYNLPLTYVPCCYPYCVLLMEATVPVRSSVLVLVHSNKTVVGPRLWYLWLIFLFNTQV